MWLNLDDLVNLDAIGDPVDGLIEVEIVMEDQRVIGACWPEEFCDAVVDVLRVSAGRPTATPGSPADTRHHHDEPTAAATTAAAPDEVPATASPTPTQPTPTQPTPTQPTPTQSAADTPTTVRTGTGNGALDPSTQEAAASGAQPPTVPERSPASAAAAPTAPATPAPATAALELEDVVYLGGYPGQSKRRKKCVAGLTRSALELSGPGDLRFTVGWDVVRTIEVQNSDEARFRMNTKIHRDASALVVECDQGVTLLFEARDCPTIALRSAISQLLDGLSVVVV